MCDLVCTIEYSSVYVHVCVCLKAGKLQKTCRDPEHGVVNENIMEESDILYFLIKF